MTELSPRARKKKITYVASLKGVEKAELALRRLGLESKLNFAKSRLLSRSTVTKFFNREPIQLDSFKRICEALSLNWQTIAEVSADNEDIKQIEKKQIQSVSVIETEAESVQTIARKVTVLDEQNQEIQTVVVILEGDFNSVQKDVLFWHDNLSKKYPNSTIKVKTIKPGSIKLIIEGSQKDIEMLLADFELGELTEIEGFPIEDIQVLNEGAEDDKSSEQKWRLVEEIRSNSVERENLGGADLSDADLSDADLSDANLSRAFLRDADLSGANLSRAFLSSADLIGANLSGANLSGANLSGTNLRNADLSGTNLRNADLRDAGIFNLRDADIVVLSGANLGDADIVLRGTNLSRANLSRADLRDTNLSRAVLNGADLSDADLSRANLSGADLSRANLRDTNLSRANLNRAFLIGADLSGANLSGADLSGAFLSGADLSRANLSDADLSRANLSDADLSGADLSGANLTRSFLWGAKLIETDLSSANVETAQFGYNSGISEQMKQDLIKRGAIFEDSPGNRSGILSPY